MIKYSLFKKLNVFSLFCFFSITTAQYDFELQDLNPNSETYGQLIGADDYLGDIFIVFFGHEY
ncbi:MAG: hypothetical protein CMG57_02490 [Candidatus Marinimicrobia bacterium]|nr:hypothetical protein [Candidatus Neomarinimicrobiota bacterium]